MPRPGSPESQLGTCPCPLQGEKKKETTKNNILPPHCLIEGDLMCSSWTQKLTSPQVTRPDQKVGSTQTLGHLGAPRGGQCLHFPTLPRVPPSPRALSHVPSAAGSAPSPASTPLLSVPRGGVGAVAPPPQAVPELLSLVLGQRLHLLRCRREVGSFPFISAVLL